MHRRLEDRIALLCRQAVTLPDSEKLHKVLEELREALADHIMRTRCFAFVPERRNHEIRTTSDVAAAD
jgi:hypothetical protein